jgi:mono/diheme cytochrome c family protein
MITKPIFTPDRSTCVSLAAPLLVSLALLATGCRLPGRPDPADRPVPESQVVKFETLFGQHCAGCHGADGKLGPAPPLNNRLFRAGMAEMDLEMVIAAGRPGTPMPPFARKKGGPLTEVQIQVLLCELKGIRYKVVRKGEWESVKITIERDVVVPVLAASTVGWIASPLGQGPLPAASAMFPGRTEFKGITPKWGAPGAYPKDAPSFQDDEEPPPRTQADFERIRKTVFAQACAGCHGDRGQGVEKGGERRRAINEPAFLALISDQALRRYVITGRPDLGMPSYHEARAWNPEFSPLDSGKVTELAALLAEWKRAAAASGK